MRARLARMRAAQVTPDDRGETLVELLITIVLMGLVVTAVIGAIATSIYMSDVHRKQTVAGDDVRSYAEALETSVANSPSAYKSCAQPSDYLPTYTLTGPYTPSITAVTYWNGSSFSATCSTDTGVQQVTLQVRSNDGRATEKLTIVIRKPCRSTTDFPQDAACS